MLIKKILGNLIEAEFLVAVRLQTRILLPGGKEYKARVDSYLCNSAQLQLAYISQPGSALEVSAAVKALVGVGQAFAVRSGGYNIWAGGGNLDGEVITIDLSLTNSAMYGAAAEGSHRTCYSVEGHIRKSRKARLRCGRSALG